MRSRTGSAPPHRHWQTPARGRQSRHTAPRMRTRQRSALRYRSASDSRSHLQRTDRCSRARRQRCRLPDTTRCPAGDADQLRDRDSLRMPSPAATARIGAREHVAGVIDRNTQALRGQDTPVRRCPASTLAALQPPAPGLGWSTRRLLHRRLRTAMHLHTRRRSADCRHRSRPVATRLGAADPLPTSASPRSSTATQGPPSTHETASNGLPSSLATTLHDGCEAVRLEVLRTLP